MRGVPSMSQVNASNERKPGTDWRYLLELSNLLNSSLDLDQVLNLALDGVERLLEAETSSIYGVDYEQAELFFHLTRGPAAARIKDLRVKIGEGVAGWVAQTGQAQITNDVRQESHFSRRMDQDTGYQTRSMITAPLLVKGAVTGVVQVLNKRGGGIFSEQDMELLLIQANQIAVALENARLYGALRAKHQTTAEELKTTQSRLIRSERLAALSGLALGITHHLRNPTMSIGGFARRLAKGTAQSDPQLNRYAQVILAESLRLEQMVARASHVMQLAAKPHPTDLNALLRQVVENWRPDHPGMEVRLEPAPHLPPVPLDPILVGEAVGELLANSLQAGSQRAALRTWSQEGWLCLEVADDGRGVGAEDLPRVWDPFFSTSADRHGLGLTLVQRVAQVHMGEVDMQSTPDLGARVVLKLPLKPPS